MSDWITKFYYQKHPLRWVLWPFSVIYLGIIFIRRQILTRLFQTKFEVPMIIVGNISLGGVGKTPVVLAIVEALQAKGLRVGIVSRGYGASIKQFPHQVLPTEEAGLVGDEPLLLARATSAPVVISPDRVVGVKQLIEQFDCQVIVSDDGLQHYKMGRAIEIAVIDGTRGMGNGLCLPAGPLREPKSRLNDVDFCIVNSGVWPNAFPMSLAFDKAINLKTSTLIALSDLSNPIYAVAGIGNPDRFFDLLSAANIVINPVIFPDHFAYQPDSLTQYEGTVVMTEKDAVKCQRFAKDHWYFLPVKAKIAPAFWEALFAHQSLQGVLNK